MSPSCGISAGYANNDPAKLVEEFILRERRGDFLAPNGWLSQAVRCPQKLQPADAIPVIESADIVASAYPKRDIFQARIAYRIVGEILETAQGREFKKLAPLTSEEMFTVEKTDFGWRIVEPVKTHVSAVGAVRKQGVTAKASRQLARIVLAPSSLGAEKLATAWQSYIDKASTPTAEQLLWLLSTSKRELKKLRPLGSELLVLRQRLERRDATAAQVVLALISSVPAVHFRPTLLQMMSGLIRLEPRFFLDSIREAQENIPVKMVHDIVLYYDQHSPGRGTRGYSCELQRRSNALASLAECAGDPVHTYILTLLNSQKAAGQCKNTLSAHNTSHARQPDSSGKSTQAQNSGLAGTAARDGA